MLYVFLHRASSTGTRRLAHVNVTEHHPSAAWTLQQLRKVIADADDHRYLIHDRDSISGAGQASDSLLGPSPVGEPEFKGFRREA